MPILDPAQRHIHDAALRLFAKSGGDRITVRDLALEAGVARGTIYNHVRSIDTLFEEIADQLVGEMHERLRQTFDTTGDPVQRMAICTRLLLRRTHDEPDWGRFICRFGQTPTLLKEIWFGQTQKDLIAGVESGRYCISKEQLTTAMAMVIGSVLGACMLVLEGYRGWREAGTEVAELILRALGISATEAQELSNMELPDLWGVSDVTNNRNSYQQN